MKNKIQYFENLRVIAVLGVIVTHAIYLLMVLEPHYKIGASWWGGNIVQAAIRFVVPIMFMQSGALLLHPEKKESMKVFFKKRLLKVLLPFITWSVISALIISIGDKKNIIPVLLGAFSHPVFYHLWFVYALLGLYIVTPLFRLLIKNATQKDLEYFLVLWLIITGVLPLIKKLFNYSIDLEISYLYGYIGYFVLGYYLAVTDIKRQYRYGIYCLGFIGYVTMLLGTYYLTALGSSHGTHTDFFFHEYLNIGVILLSTAVFVYAKYARWLNQLDVSLDGKLNIARICFGVYLSQSLVLNILRFQLHIVGTVENPFWGSLEASVITAVVCFGFFIVLDLMKKYSFITSLTRFIY